MRCKIKVNRILYPKRDYIDGGEWGIIAAITEEVIEGEAPKNNNYGNFSIKGNMCKLKAGDIIEVTLGKEESNKYGYTYELSEIHLSMNNLTNEELVEYTLEITTNTKIKEEMQNMDINYLAEIIKNKDIESMTKIKGMGEATAKKLLERIDDKINIHKAISELNKFGLTGLMINKICESYESPEKAVYIVKNNPYDLIKRVDGVGYLKADEIAQKCGVDRKSPYRIKAAVEHILELNAEVGKSYISIFDFTSELMNLLDLSYDIIKPILTEMRKDRDILLSNKSTRVSLYKYAKLENEIAYSLLERINSENVIKKPENWMETVREIEEAQGWRYTDEQLEAIELGLDNNVIAISGLAGTGKTTIVEAIDKILQKAKVGTCALSAKAAQRISEVTKKPSYTIHRMFGFHATGVEKALKNRTMREMLQNPPQDEDRKIKPYELFNVLVVDEASMNNGTLFLEIFNHAKKDTKIIILGDPGQLTAIGNCAVFADILKSKVVPSKNLTKIHRQAQKSAMITESINFRMQNPICTDNFRGSKVMGELQDLELHVYDDPEEITEVILDNFFRDLEICNGNVLDVQVILPMKNRGANSTKNINNAIQDRYIKDKDFGMEVAKDTCLYVGDKVINTSNNYEAKTIYGNTDAIFNGSIGIVKDIDFTRNEIIIDFGEDKIIIFEKDSFKNLNLAYAITVHSSQGSAWKRTIAAFDNSSYIMLNCEIVYTAMTRAYDYCTTIFEFKAMKKAIKTVEQKNKQTFLTQFLDINNGDKPLIL